MKMNLDRWLLLMAFLMAVNPAQARPAMQADSRERVAVSVVPAQTKVSPGTDVPVAVILDHQRAWHSWANKGNVPTGMRTYDDAINTEIKIEIPPGSPLRADASLIQWPQVHEANVDVGDGPQKFAVFSDKAIAYVPVTIKPDAAPGKASFDLLLTFQSCDDKTCLMPVVDHKLTVTFDIVEPGALATTPAVTDDLIFKAFDPTIWARVHADTSAPITSNSTTPTPPTVSGAGVEGTRPTFFGFQLPRTDGPFGLIILILLSMLGGFILNLTPCVLPIIPIKILTISQHANSPSRTLVLGLWMAMGVVAFWAGIGVPAALVSGAADPSRIFGIWWITLGIGVLIAFMGIGIMGLFTIQLPAAVYAVNPKAETAWGSFLFGVMTALLGLPCFGFVAGALLAGAATLPATTVMIVFASIGVGMAAPYLVLSAKPSLLKHMPRTGPASELVKQVMGLLLLAAAAYFVGSGMMTLVLDYPYLAKHLHWWVVAVFAMVAGIWLIVRTFQISSKAIPRITFTIIGLIVGGISLAFALNVTHTAREEWQHRQTSAVSDDGFLVGEWNEYTPARFENARKAGHIVVLDFTASWCLTCQVLRRTVLDPEPVKTAFSANDVVVFEIDLSSLSAPGWQTLRDLGRTGIPLLAIYGPGFSKPWLANAYTPDQVMAALDDARSSTVARR